MSTFIGFACGSSVLIEFFAVVDDFFDGFEVSNGPSSFRAVEFHADSCFAY